MNYQEFKNKWLGKGIDFDGSFGNQCMDVYRMYVKEVLGIPQSPAVQGAKNVWDTYLSAYFDRIPNTPEGVPVQGDIVIWGMNPYGHIGICDSADTQYLTCFEQNWSEGGTTRDGQGVTELRRHTYTNVLGWLHFKSQEETTVDTSKALVILDNFKVDQHHSSREGAMAAAVGAFYDLGKSQEKINSLEADCLEYQDRINKLTAKLLEEQKANSDCQAQLSIAKEYLETVETQKNDNWMLYKNKNDDYNALLLKTQDPLELIKMFISLFKK